jgi:dTDP-4-amino-4,6-dideoxygalactose transaminase
MISFNKPTRTGAEDEYVLDAMRSTKISGDGKYGRLCQTWFERYLGSKKTLLTPSCTQALEIAAILIDIQPGDEVIMPSYTFVSTANAFVLRGAKIVFIDIRPDTMNMSENLIVNAITSRTKAIILVHYAGVACEMKIINKIAKENGILIVEDAAQGVMATYDSLPLGTFGDLAAYSFHETKNLTSGGEGGLLIINNENFLNRAEVIREKGTNRSQFFRGMIDKYTWIDIGSSYLPSELQAAYLWGQLQQAEHITAARIASWNVYRNGLADLEDDGRLKLPDVPPECRHNGHIFYLKCKDLMERSALLDHLNQNGINAVFHYVPLHSAPGGMRYGRFHHLDQYTTSESEKLVRLPLWYGITEEEQAKVISFVYDFFK